jgi:murein DD-endopeptidase MepM/ murein hydrolase activator NlpD
MRDVIARIVHQALAPLQRRWRSLHEFEFRDFRLILEQDGGVHYFQVPGRVQRRFALVSLGIVGGVAALLLGMAVTNAVLSYTKDRLERSHEEIYRALLETYEGVEGQSDKPTEEQMLAIAAAIRQRNGEIERFVDRSLASISGENLQLSAALRETGLTAAAIRVIQQSTPVGGFDDRAMPRTNRGQVNDLADALAHNRSLRDVLDGLPDHLPLDQPQVSSSFGLRVHPLTGRPQFHTGVDLVPGDSLLIRPVLAGKVVLASYGKELGNVVVVRHGNGVNTLYGHMASIAVQTGDAVSVNTVLGVVGNTGTGTTGRHLHFEVTVGGIPVNPLKVIQTTQNVRKIEAQY